MNIRYAYVCMCMMMIGCGKKPSTTHSLIQSKESAQQSEKHCFPVIQGIASDQIPRDMEIDCVTGKPLHPVKFDDYLKQIRANAWAAKTRF